MDQKTDTRKKSKPLKDMFIETDIPHWLMPPNNSPAKEPFTPWHWNEILTKLMEGQTLTNIIRDNPNLPQDIGRLQRWIHSDPERKGKYEDAQMIGTEVMADHMLRIANGDDNPIEDVQRSTLKVNTYKWLIACRNRDRYGDKRQVEQTVTVNIADAMEKADTRVIEGKAELLKDD